MKPPTQSCVPVDNITHTPVKLEPYGVTVGIQSQNSCPVAGFIDISPCSHCELVAVLHTSCCSLAVPKCPPTNSRVPSAFMARLSSLPTVLKRQTWLPTLPKSRWNAAT